MPESIHITQYSHGLNRSILPIKNAARSEAVTEVAKGKIPKSEGSAYTKLRTARSDARLVGVRERRNKAKEDEAAAAKK